MEELLSRGTKCFEQRLWIEAEHWLQKFRAQGIPNSTSSYYQLSYQVAKILRPKDYWRELAEYSYALAVSLQLEILAQLLHVEQQVISHMPNRHKILAANFILKKAQGKREEALKASMAHLEYLLKNNLIHLLLEYSQSYQNESPNMLAFHLMEIAALQRFGESQKVEQKVINVLTMLEMRPCRLVDTSLVDHALIKKELIKGMGELHDIYLACASALAEISLIKENKSKLDGLTCKRIIELLLWDSCDLLYKLILQIFLQEDRKDLSHTVWKFTKSRRGFSFVNFTKDNVKLKETLKTAFFNSKDGRDDSIDVINLEVEAILKVPVKVIELEENTFEPHSDQDDEQEYQVNTIKTLRLQNPEIETYPDLVVTYMFMGFHRVVEWLILKAKGEDVPRYINSKLSYLELLHRMERKEWWMALALVAELKGDESITEDQLIELEYVEASAYESLGNVKVACGILKTIRQKNENYRLVRERLARIEKN